MSMICPKCGGSGYIITGSEARGLRHKRKLTLNHVSKRMGISLPYLADLEHDRRQWNTELLSAFNKAIGK